MVYLLHFSEKFHHTQHYIGFVEDEGRLGSRMIYHKTGKGSRLLKAVSEKGIGFVIARLWRDGDRNFERRLKNRKNAKNLCPICKKVH